MLLVDTLAAQSIIIMHVWVNQSSHYRLMTFECPLFDLGEKEVAYIGVHSGRPGRFLLRKLSCGLILPPEIPSIISSL